MDSVATATTSGINSLSGWGAQVAHLSSESGIAYLKEIRGRFYRAAACRKGECRHPMGPLRKVLKLPAARGDLPQLAGIY
jgi:hypothetical protein